MRKHGSNTLVRSVNVFLLVLEMVEKRFKLLVFPLLSIGDLISQVVTISHCHQKNKWSIDYVIRIYVQ